MVDMSSHIAVAVDATDAADAADATESLDSEETWLASAVTESDRSTLNALQKTSKELDGLLNDLSLETSRLTNESIMPDEDGYDSDEGAEHGERELREQLDSIVFLTPWSNGPPGDQHDEGARSVILSSETYDSNSSSIKLEQQQTGESPAQSAPTKVVATSLTQEMEAENVSNDASTSINEKSNNDATIAVARVRHDMALVSEKGPIKESTTMDSMESGRVDQRAIPPKHLSNKNSPKMLCLQLLFSLFVIAILIGIVAALFANDDVQPVSEENLAGYKSITTSPTPLPAPTSLLNGPTVAPTIHRSVSPTSSLTSSPTLHITPPPTLKPTVGPTVPSSNQSLVDDVGKKKLGKVPLVDEMDRQYRLRGYMVQEKLGVIFELP